MHSKRLAMRRTLLTIVAFTAAAFVLPDPAQAQADFPLRGSHSPFRCEPHGNGQDLCRADAGVGLRTTDDDGGCRRLLGSWIATGAASGFRTAPLPV